MKSKIQSLLPVFLCVSVLLGTNAEAWVSTPEATKEHHFVYRFKTHSSAPTETYEYSSTASSYEEAYGKAATACYKHFRDSIKASTSKRHISEDQGLSIIDVCANPRSL